MTATVEPQALPDAGPCRWCTDLQWDHKRGKGGCKVLGCGCDKYLPPKSVPVATDSDGSVLDSCGHCVLLPTAAGEVRATQTDCPEHGDRPKPAAGLVDPVETLDVERRRRREPEPLPGGDPAPDPAAQAAHAEAVAAIDEQLAQPEPTDDEIADEIDRAEDAAEIERLTAELGRARDALRRGGVDVEHAGSGDVGELFDAYVAEMRDAVASMTRVSSEAVRKLRAELSEERTANASLHRQLAEQEQHAARQLGARSAELAQVRAELDRANTARQRLQEQLASAVHTGLSAAAQVIGRYTAHACLDCGARYGKPYTDHGCGPLTPVVVTITRADRPGSNTTEEN